MDYLSELNPAQREAVLHKDGPLLIIAGAGAGKTKTLTHRMLHLMRNGVTPDRILAITFTNKAAGEMKERVEKIIVSDKILNLPISSPDRPFISTFHRLGLHIIRSSGSVLGVKRRFKILDRDESKSAIKEAMKNAGLDPKNFEPGAILSIISRQKGACINADLYDGSDYLGENVKRVWQIYEEILKRENSLDFDDLILKALLILQKDKTAREKFKNVWQYIHIDEYQDTNLAQYELSSILSENHKNICAVGDVDQNIYTWRGASLAHILNFEKDFPNAKIIRLEENYRSTGNILKAADGIISKNKMRYEKNLFTKKEAGEKISLFTALNEEDEAGYVANTAKSLIENGMKTDEIAVMYRANFQSRVLENAFLREGVPYKVIGTRFFERKEVKDVLSYIETALEDKTGNLSSLKRIINTPPRGLGKVAMLKIMSGKESELTGLALKSWQNLKEILARIKKSAESDTPSEIVKMVIRESGLDKMYKDMPDNEERLENLKELVSFATKFDKEKPNIGIENLLSESTLQSDQDELADAPEGVRLMTVHSAKGLEFDYCIITGLEDGLFPHHSSLQALTPEEREEERRLFYVALTRARKKVFLTYAQTRTVFGRQNINLPSEFITDIDQALIEEEGSSTFYL